jgi:hypothetical protein
MRRARRLLAAAVVAATTVDAWAQGCAMCGSAFTADDPTSRAFGWSIAFLIAMPYTVFAVVAGWLVVAHRRRGRRAAVISLESARRDGVPSGEFQGGLP